MAESKLRIPRLAAAAILLGGACGDDGNGGGGSTKGENVSKSRISSVAKSICKFQLRCDEDEFRDYYTDVDDCADSLIDDFGAPSSDEDKACGDALLDYASCSAQLGCDDDPEEKCSEFYDSYVELCDVSYEDYQYSAADPAKGKAARKRLRIPRP